MLLVCPAYAFAQNSSLDVSQYAHTSWKISEGFSKGFIRSIAQTADGYLWLGTEFGLLRFDGVRAVPWEPPAGQHLPSSDIRSVQGARDGRLWIGTYNGLASWKDGKLTHYPELDGQVIEALLEDREGTIWVAGWAPSAGRLCRIQSGNIQCHGEDGRFGSGVTPLYEDSGGNLWAGAMTGLWRWKPGPPTLYPMPDPAQRIYALIESDDGGILIATHRGITKLRNGKSEAYPLPAGFQPHRLHRDHDGGLWIGALVDRGLLHIHDGRMDRFSQADGLSGRSVNSFFEDREGNIWVATAEGLDRFRDFAIPTFSDLQGFSSGGIFSVLTAKDGSLWLGTSDGLNRWNKGQITNYRYRGFGGVRGGSPVSGLTAGREADSRGTVREITDSGLPDKAHSLFQDARGRMWVGTPSGVAFLKSDRFVPVASVPHGIVFSFTDDSAGNVWVSHQEGLFHLFQERVVERIPWARLGRRQPASALLHDAVQGGLWLGFRDGGVAYFKDGQLRTSYAGVEGLGEGMVRGFYIDGHGTLWVPTEGGLSRIKDGHILTLTSQNGLPCNTVHWMMEDDAQSVWLYLACGLVRVGRSELDAWTSHPKQTIQVTVFDSSDGVSSHRFTGAHNSVVAKSADGKLWFVRPGGVSVIDPHHLPINTLPPPVHIEQITADGKTYWRNVSGEAPLSPTAAACSRSHDRLHGAEPGRPREGAFPLQARRTRPRLARSRQRSPGAILEPRSGHYASGSGRPTTAACGMKTARCWNSRSRPRTTRRAGSKRSWPPVRSRSCGRLSRPRPSGRSRSTSDGWTSASTSARASRGSCTIRCCRAFTDCCCSSRPRRTCCRSARPRPKRSWMVRLNTRRRRSPKAATRSRACARRPSNVTISRSRSGRLATSSRPTRARDQPPTFSVAVEGETRDLHPIVRDEIYKIAAEALRNAFRHAHAGRVEVEIRYDDEQFRLRVRDDGKGIDPAVLANQGLEGHYGLRGMPERAALIGGKLAVWSEVGAGTEVELRLPASIVYATSPRRSWWSRLLASKTPAHVGGNTS